MTACMTRGREETIRVERILLGGRARTSKCRRAQIRSRVMERILSCRRDQFRAWGRHSRIRRATRHTQLTFCTIRIRMWEESRPKHKEMASRWCLILWSTTIMVCLRIGCFRLEGRILVRLIERLIQDRAWISILCRRARASSLGRKRAKIYFWMMLWYRMTAIIWSGTIISKRKIFRFQRVPKNRLSSIKSTSHQSHETKLICCWRQSRGGTLRTPCRIQGSRQAISQASTQLIWITPTHQLLLLQW